MYITWTGTDVLLATKFQWRLTSKLIYSLKCLLFARIVDRFVQKHVVVSEHLIDELKPLRFKKPIEVKPNPVWYPKKYKKRKHAGFNVLYYRHKSKTPKFTDWIYGYDIIIGLLKYPPLKNLSVYEVDGSQNMSEVYPIIDFYARPNNHDGNPRMIRECEIQGIPYYHTTSNPSLKDLESAIIKVGHSNKKK